MAAADQVEERRRELVRPGLAALTEQGRHERRLGVRRRLLLPLAVVPGSPLAAEEPEHEHDDEERGNRRERGEHEQRAERAVDPLVDAVAILLEVGRVLGLLLDDPVEPGALLDLHLGRRGERLAGVQRAQLDELLRRDVDRPEQDPRPGERDVAANPDRMSPCADDVARPGHRGRQLPEALLPLVAPDPEVDVHDVVVRDREAGEAVADGEGSRLVRRLEAPDDSHAAAEVLDAERAGRPAGLELGVGAGPVGSPALGDGDSRDLFAVAVRELTEAVRELEAAAEGDGDPLLDRDRPVRPHLGADIGRDELVRLRVRGRSDCERGDRAAATARSPRRAPRVAPPPRCRRTRES